MIIQNYRDLAQSRSKKNGLKILEAGLEAASPDIGLGRYLKAGKICAGKKPVFLSEYSAVHMVAFGKSADRMALAARSILGITSGIVVVPQGSRPTVRGRGFSVYESTHPTPSQASVNTAKAITKFLKRRKKSEFVLFLVSGGSSSLLCLPDGIDLSDKMYINDLMLKSGATIQEFNCVRKHLSQIKGGRLVENLPCDGIALVMSDVVGDDLSSIASGTTYCDGTTFLDALRIIKKYGLAKRFPPDALARIKDGIDGKISETPKKPQIPNYVVAQNSDCLDAMQKKAKDLGYSVSTITISGNIKAAVQKIKKNMPKRKKSCLLFGGETTVEVIGNGKGGRNQEFVLRLIKNLQNIDSEIIVSSVGTDGIDGNTKFAGAISENLQIDSKIIDSYLRSSDSGSFFAKYGGLIKTGYTHTNLMDIGVILL